MERKIKPKQKWIHYKNPTHEYEIIGIAKHSETLEEMVIYKALYLGEFAYGQLWARPKREFLGKVEKEGKIVDRFKLKN